MMMGATQIDRFGNSNIANIGPWERPAKQLLGVRGGPGNTINHAVSFWIPKHTPQVFVESVDMVSGIGYDRAAKLGRSAAGHRLPRVVTNLAVLDFDDCLDQPDATAHRPPGGHPSTRSSRRPGSSS